jgi:uncharacterized protein YdeI (BOF family)
MNRKLLLVLSVVFSVLFVTACAQAGTPPSAVLPSTADNVATYNSKNSPAPPPQKAGPLEIAQPPNTGLQAVKIGDILSGPEKFATGKVVIEGKIISQCGAGCWFTISDGTGTIYVDLAPSNLTIPQKRGAVARVYGKVVTKGSDTYLIGEKVEF